MIKLNEVWMFGPAMIPVVTVVVLLSIISGFLYLRFFSPYKNKTDDDIRDISSNAIILTAIVYLFSSIPLNFSQFISDPMAIISYPSGHQEFFLGIIAALTYLTVHHVRQKIMFIDSLSAIIYVILISDFLFAFLVSETGRPIDGGPIGVLPFSEHPVSLYTMILSMIILLWLKKSGRLTDQLKLIRIVSVWAFGKWLISLVHWSPQFFNIYLPNSTYLILTICTVIFGSIYLILRKKQVNLSWKK